MANNEEALQDFDVEEFLDERLDPVIRELRERLDVTEVDALGICLFSLADRINYENSETPIQIDVQTDSVRGHLKLSWFSRTQRAPHITGYRDNVIR